MRSEKQLEKKTQEADRLKSDLESLRKEFDQELEASKATKKKVVLQNALIKQLTDEKKKLRQVILSSTTRQKISDEVIKQRFANLRQQIQAIANSAAYDLDRRLIACYPAHDQFGLGFQRHYNLCDPQDRVFLIRSKVYEIIHYLILIKDIFGVASSCQNAQNSQNLPNLPTFQSNQEIQMEHSLGDFEGYLRAKKGTAF